MDGREITKKLTYLDDYYYTGVCVTDFKQKERTTTATTTIYVMFKIGSQ